MADVWTHVDKHGDLIAVSRPGVGGWTIHGRNKYGDKTDVWLDEREAAELAAVLTAKPDAGGEP